MDNEEKPLIGENPYKDLEKKDIDSGVEVNKKIKTLFEHGDDLETLKGSPEENEKV